MKAKTMADEWEYKWVRLASLDIVMFGAKLKRLGKAGWQLCGFAYDCAILVRRVVRVDTDPGGVE